MSTATTSRGSGRVARAALIVGFAAISGCAVYTPPGLPQVKLPEPTFHSGLVVRVTSVVYDRTYAVAGIAGEVENTTSVPFRSISLQFDVLDASGTKVADAIASTAGLGGDAKWAFQAYILAPSRQRFSSIGAPRVTSFR